MSKEEFNKKDSLYKEMRALDILLVVYLTIQIPLIILIIILAVKGW